MSGPPDKRVIMLIHGLASNPWMMALLAARLRWRGYQVIVWSYWSVGKTIQNHAEGVRRVWEKLERDATVNEICIVAHSMGGIVARTALAMGKPAKLARMVMLAPPNRGSHWASWFGPLLRPLCTTLDQLASRPDSFVNQLPPPHDLEVGIIAAGFDMLVPTSHTYLPTQSDHYIVPAAMHSGVLFRRSVVEQIDHFLRAGSFLRRTPGTQMVGMEPK